MPAWYFYELRELIKTWLGNLLILWQLHVDASRNLHVIPFVHLSAYKVCCKRHFCSSLNSRPTAVNSPPPSDHDFRCKFDACTDCTDRILSLISAVLWSSMSKSKWSQFSMAPQTSFITGIRYRSIASLGNVWKRSNHQDQVSVEKRARYQDCTGERDWVRSWTKVL